MSSRLFKRAIAVTLARPVAGSFFSAEPDSTVITDMRVQFTVEKNLKASANKAELTLYNLWEDSRAGLQVKPLKVRVDAGYDGNLERLFIGDLRHSQSKHLGPDWETRLELGDGDRALKHARISKAYKGGTQAKTILADICRSMGVSAPINLDGRRELLNEYATGVALTGLAHQNLTFLLSALGLEWSIQDGALQILSSNELRAGEPVVISQDTGMVGSPEFGTPDKKGGKPRLTVRMLLYPGLTPGRKIDVRASGVTGVFRIERVVHSGDTHGTDWFSDIEAK